MKRFQSLVLGAAASAVLLLPSLAWAEDDGEMALPERLPPASVRPKLVIGGLAITGIGYGAAVLSASLASDLPGMSYMRIPVVGPWMSLAKTACPADQPDCGFDLYLRGILTVVDGLMQLSGLGIAGEGLFLRTAPSAPSGTAAKVPLFTIRPAPIVTGTVTGFGVVGRF